MTAPRMNYPLLAAGISGLMALTGVTTYLVATYHKANETTTAAGKIVDVTITTIACEPNELTIPEGRTTFLITNKSNRALEWEILQGVMVVEERENIAPGFRQKLTANLQAGSYDITCGLLSNPRGRLNVVAGAGVKAKARPALAELVGPLAEYSVYIQLEVSELAARVSALSRAVRTGNQAQARALYASARIPYEHIKPVARLFSDLDRAIDARANDFHADENDAGFTGFHRLEFALFAQETTGDISAIADKLEKDVRILQNRIEQLDLPPEKMAGVTAQFLDVLAPVRIDGAEERYSHTDLSDLQANLDGVKKVTDLFAPLIMKTSPEIWSRINDDFGKLQAVMDHYRQDDGKFTAHNSLSQEDRVLLHSTTAILSQNITAALKSLGIE